jgi:hypothetical protein
MRAWTVATAVLAAAGSLGPATAQSTSSNGPSPHVRILKPPDFSGEYAIWGATGFDRSGHIFFGITSGDKSGSGSAHLVELNPATDTFSDRGNVVNELSRLGLRRPNESQMKIHSRIVQAADGYRYFPRWTKPGKGGWIEAAYVGRPSWREEPLVTGSTSRQRRKR